MDNNNQSSHSLAEELQRLANLRQQGMLTEDEFHDAKRKLLSPDSAPVGDTKSEPQPITPKARNSTIKYVVAGIVAFALFAAGIAFKLSNTDKTASEPPITAQVPTTTESESTNVAPAPIAKQEEPVAEPERPSLPKTVEAPIINVGDKYTYETDSTDSNDKTTTSTQTREITAINGDRVTVTVTSGKTGKARTLIYDRSWNLLETGDTPTAGLIYKPAIQYFDFPLTVGKKWKALSEDTDKKTGKSRQYIINAEVWGWDEIIVGADKFDALKIIISSEVLDGDKKSTGMDISWYAPSIGRTVRSELSGEDAEGRRDKKTVVLSSFSSRSSGHTKTPANQKIIPNLDDAQADDRIPNEASKMGLRVPASRERFLQMYRRQGGVCDQAPESLRSMNALRAVTSECHIPAPCEPNTKGISCRGARLGFNNAGRTVLYQITMDVQKDQDYLDLFDNIYGRDRRKIKGDVINSIVFENNTIRGGVRIEQTSLYLPKQSPEQWIFIILNNIF